MSERTAGRMLQDELQQSQPFRSQLQEASIALMRTASVVSRRFARVVEPHGLSLAQYNVLRILRGAGDDGLPTLAIRDRMIDEGSTVTRLLDKLENASLVLRDRARSDRRQVRCTITAQGKALLATLDPLINATDRATMETLAPDQRESLLSILAVIRTELRD